MQGCPPACAGNTRGADASLASSSSSFQIFLPWLMISYPLLPSPAHVGFSQPSPLGRPSEGTWQRMRRGALHPRAKGRKQPFSGRFIYQWIYGCVYSSCYSEWVHNPEPDGTVVSPGAGKCFIHGSRPCLSPPKLGLPAGIPLSLLPIVCPLGRVSTQSNNPSVCSSPPSKSASPRSVQKHHPLCPLYGWMLSLPPPAAPSPH